MQKDMRAVTTPVTAPMAKEPLKMPKKTPTDLKKAEASNVCVLAPAGWYATIDLHTKYKTIQINWLCLSMTNAANENDIFKIAFLNNSLTWSIMWTQYHFILKLFYMHVIFSSKV